MEKLAVIVLLVVSFMVVVASCETIAKYDSEANQEVSKVILNGIY